MGKSAGAGDAASRDGGLGRWLAAGAAFGLLSLNRPNALLCVAAIAVGPRRRRERRLVARRRSGRSSLPFEENPLRTLRFAAAFLAGTGARRRASPRAQPDRLGRAGPHLLARRPELPRRQRARRERGLPRDSRDHARHRRTGGGHEARRGGGGGAAAVHARGLGALREEGVGVDPRRTRRRARSLSEEDPFRPLRRRGAAQLQLPVVPRPERRPEAPLRGSWPPRAARGRGLRPRAPRVGRRGAPRAPRLVGLRPGVRPLGRGLLRRDAVPPPAPRGARAARRRRRASRLPDAWRAQGRAASGSRRLPSRCPRGASRSGRRGSTTAAPTRTCTGRSTSSRRATPPRPRASPRLPRHDHPDPGLMWLRIGQGVGGRRANGRCDRVAREGPRDRAASRRRRKPTLAAAHESRGVDRVLAHDALARSARSRGRRRAVAGRSRACS